MGPLFSNFSHKLYSPIFWVPNFQKLRKFELHERVRIFSIKQEDKNLFFGNNEYLLYTLVVLARFFELSNKIFGFIGPLRGWQQGNLTFETPKESKRSIFRSC